MPEQIVSSSSGEILAEIVSYREVKETKVCFNRMFETVRYDIIQDSRN